MGRKWPLDWVRLRSSSSTGEPFCFPDFPWVIPAVADGQRVGWGLLEPRTMLFLKYHDCEIWSVVNRPWPQLESGRESSASCTPTLPQALPKLGLSWKRACPRTDAQTWNFPREPFVSSCGHCLMSSAPSTCYSENQQQRYWRESVCQLEAPVRAGDSPARRRRQVELLCPEQSLSEMVIQVSV